jgi:hypothetical protein
MYAVSSKNKTTYLNHAYEETLEVTGLKQKQDNN